MNYIKSAVRCESREMVRLVNDANGRSRILGILKSDCRFTKNLSFLCKYKDERIVDMYPNALFEFVKVELDTEYIYYVLEGISGGRLPRGDNDKAFSRRRKLRKSSSVDRGAGFFGGIIANIR